MKSNTRERLADVPDIWRHAYLQAALIVGAAASKTNDIVWGRWTDFWQKTQSLDESTQASTLVSRIGLWYDYSCMPQPSSQDEQQRTASNRDAPFQKALFRLPALIEACPIIILRSPNDGYGGRGWCGTELSIGRDRGRHIVLRTDLLGKKVCRSDILSSKDWSPETPNDTAWRWDMGRS